MIKFLLSFCLFCVPSLGFAQSVEHATDTELKAAYCLGVARSQLEMARSDPAAALAVEAVAERAKRLLDYLGAKGFTAGRETAGIKTAISRGTNDFGRCRSEANQPSVNRCESACPKITDFSDTRANTRALQCVSKCSNVSETCKRLKGCLQSFLPF